MGTNVKLSKIGEQTVYWDNGVEGVSRLEGFGFLNEVGDGPHNLEMEACILDSGGDAPEDKLNIEIVQPNAGGDYWNDSQYYIKVTVKPYDKNDKNFYGLRSVVIKQKSEDLQKDGSCPAGSTTCSVLLNAIRIRKVEI